MEGLEKFREAFAEFTDNYIVIGGTSCDIAMTGTVVRPRATHDIDMIVIAENITEAFGERLWQFVREAGYRPEKRKHIEGEPASHCSMRLPHAITSDMAIPSSLQVLQVQARAGWHRLLATMPAYVDTRSATTM